ncbi:DUF3558 domain-containing protein [Nocardia paucivorans]|uniref:DUF3558 domain-containing protein n=1 Tax=Nocardia paucivorans TaxID=114259 RepID=UPI0002DF6D49|nr:DUF3558 domain-containing protein [Nocardia paucivorans]
MRRALLSSGLLMAVVAAGCSSEVAGTPEGTEQTTEESVAFNPCSELPDEALRAADLDPASKSTSIDPPSGPSTWRICRWDPIDGQPYMVGIASTTHTQDEVLNNPTVTGFKDVQIGDRAGKTYHQAGRGTDDLLRCYVSLPAEHGMHNVILSWRYSQRESAPETPPCTLAVERARALEPFLPK